MSYKSYLFTACLTVALLSACGSADKADRGVDSTDQAQPEAEKNEPETYVEGAELSDTIRLGGKTYAYHIRCAPDADLPLLVDNLKQEYYQNRVTLTVTRDGEQVIHREFTKEDFERYVSESTRGDFNSGLLLGMNCNREASTAGRLCFWAVVGWCGEGPTFRVYLTPGSDAVTIEQDFTTEDNSVEEPVIN